MNAPVRQPRRHGSGPRFDRPAKPSDNAGWIFALGLVAMVSCAPCGPIAWVMGNRYLLDCRRQNVVPDGLAVAGRIMGIVATVLALVIVCAILLVVLTASLN